MFYKVIKGPAKGKVFIAEDFKEEEQMFISQKGEKYFIDEVEELTEEEVDRCFKKEVII